MIDTTVKQCKPVKSSDNPRQQLKQHLAAAGDREVAHSPPFFALHGTNLSKVKCFSRRVEHGDGIGFQTTLFYEKNNYARKNMPFFIQMLDINIKVSMVSKVPSYLLNNQTPVLPPCTCTAPYLVPICPQKNALAAV